MTQTEINRLKHWRQRKELILDDKTINKIVDTCYPNMLSHTKNYVKNYIKLAIIILFLITIFLMFQK